MERSKLIVLMGVGGFVVAMLLIVFGVLPGLRPPSPQPYAIEFWGFGDDAEVWSDLIYAFEGENRHLQVNYTRFPEETYEENLLNKLAEGKGPDVFMLKNSWIAKHGKKLYPLPQKFLGFSAIDFQKTFVDLAYKELARKNGDILGLPLFIDSLALFYDKDIFNSAGVAGAPENWEQAVSAGKRLTQKSAGGDILRSGIALGLARNISHFFEILSALMLQNGEKIIDEERGIVFLGKEAAEAARFYASFADETGPNFSWNSRLPNSLDALAEGKTAMAFGFASDIRRLRAKNPHINLGVSAFPQPKEIRVPLTNGSYYFPAVSKLSRNPAESWKFVFFLSSYDNAGKYVRKTAKAPARRDLLSSGAASAELDVFYRQALFAENWAVPDEKSVGLLFAEAVESMVSRASSPEQAMLELKRRLGLLLP